MLTKASIVDIHRIVETPLAKFEGDLGKDHCLLDIEYREVVFDFGSVVPGSIILTRNNISAVPKFQTLVTRASEARRWSHVAIMGNGGQVWDIMPNKHVRTQTFDQFLKDVDSFAIRRLRLPVDSDVLEGSLHKFSKAKYSVMGAVELATLRKKGVPVENLPPEELVCSTFVNRVLFDALDTEVIEMNVPIIWPSHFAESSLFEDVDLSDCFFFLANNEVASQDIQPSA
ncbi:hypothetical protein A6U86_31755 [Rhizobium sp. AC27/96]|nr:hypothetical protein A6U86_31755 [Rhizobium sp. AC27/96]